MQDGEQVGHGIGHLEDEREEHTDCDAGRNAHEARNAQDAHGDDDQDGQHHDGVDVEGPRDGIANALGNAGVVAFRARVDSQEGVEHERDEEHGTGCGKHGAHVVEQACSRHGGGEVRGVGERRELVADVGARDDHARGEGGVHAQAGANGHERDAHGGRGGPRRSAGPADDGADDAAQGQENLRGEQGKAVVDERGDGAADHERADEQAHEQQDEDGFHRDEEAVQDAGEHVLEGAPVGHSHGAGNYRRAQKRHVGRVVGVGIGHEPEHIEHEGYHGEDGDQSPEQVGQARCRFFCRGGGGLVSVFFLEDAHGGSFHAGERVRHAL